jgi:hypothetical protein
MIVETPVYCRVCSIQEREPVVGYEIAVPHDADLPDSREDADGEFFHTDGSECENCGRRIDPLEAPNRDEIVDVIEDRQDADRRRAEKSIERERRTIDSGRIDTYIKEE